MPTINGTEFEVKPISKVTDPDNCLDSAWTAGYYLSQTTPHIGVMQTIESSGEKDFLQIKGELIIFRRTFCSQCPARTSLPILDWCIRGMSPHETATILVCRPDTSQPRNCSDHQA